MHGGRSLKVTLFLKNVGYADQSKDNRTGKKSRKKKIFTFF